MENYTDEKLVPAIQNLEQLIAELHKVFESERVNIDYVKALMAAYKSNPKDWNRYAKFDDIRYTRNLVDTGNGKFNLIALCWGEGHGSSIHDHSDAHCVMKILDGQLVETHYAWPTSSPGAKDTGSSVDRETEKGEEGEPMVQTGCRCLTKDNVAYMSDSLGLHRVENQSHVEKAVSLHLYSPPFDRCQTFDERTGHKATAKVTFWSKYGKRDNVDMDAVNECSAVAGVVSDRKEVIDRLH